MNMTKAQAATIVGAAFLVVLGWFYKQSGGGTKVNLMERSVGNSYDAYAHWCHNGGGNWVHRYPMTIGANCFGEAIQTEDIGLAMRGVDVSGGGYSQ